MRIAVILLALLTAMACSSRDSGQSIRRGGPGDTSPSPQQGPQGGGTTGPQTTPQEGPPIFSGSPTDAEMGNWDSSGDMPPPPEPLDKDFHFQCSAFLQDQVSRKAKVCEDCEELPYRLYRLYNFELTKENAAVDFAELEYRKIAYFGLYAELESPTWEVEEDIELINPEVNLSLSYEESFDDDKPDGVLRVFMNVAQGIADQKVYQFSNTELSVETSYLNLSESISVRNAEGEYDDTIPRLFVEIECQPKTDD